MPGVSGFGLRDLAAGCRRSPSSFAAARRTRRRAQARSLTHGEREPGRRHQALLRRRDRDVDAPLVERERHSADRRHAVHEHETPCVRAPRARPPRRRWRRPSTYRRRRSATARTRGCAARAASTLIGVDIALPVGRDAVHDDAVRLGEARPHLAELAIAADDDRVARREQVADRGFERAAARGVDRRSTGSTSAEERRQELEQNRQLRARTPVCGGGSSAARRRAARGRGRASGPASSAAAASASRSLDHSVLPQCFVDLGLERRATLISATRFASRPITACTSCSTSAAAPARHDGHAVPSPTTMSPGNTTVPPQLIGHIDLARPVLVAASGAHAPAVTPGIRAR